MKRTIDEAVSELRWRATPLVAGGNLKALRQEYTRLGADARVHNPEDQHIARSEMRSALMDILLEPSRRVKGGWFDDL